MAARKKTPEASNEASPGKQFELTPEGVQEATGSSSEAFQVELFTKAVETLWLPASRDKEAQDRALEAVYDALRSIAPRSELEGMLAAQMIATHNAAMECLRRAMKEGQGMESRDQNLKHAVKLMGIYERQLAALDKHRGKGQQKITVEHVTVEAGGQAIVGNVNTDGKARPDNGANAPALSDDSAADELSREALKPVKRAKQPAAKNSK